ncbi:hypothetical protein [Actinomyces howellii]|uniref:Uncharacterized protein n=1 Tax=Actinomyces howellii TaxID=52771 RepID=A0A448HH32_9ACTO|nr:hypothetical protein [Actinomyces howellii]VEG28063.1 Uncharacterised protein [Actinomyces howellii]
MRPDLMTALMAVLTGAVGVKLLDLAASAWRRMRAEAHDRETAVQRAERERDRWELVARATRRIAVERGARLADLPLGPGEEPMDTGDD